MSVYVFVQHSVEDFDKWKAVFEEHGENRRKNGATGHRLYRSVDDSSQQVIVNEFADLDGARAFLADPSLQEAMSRAGVTSAPNIWVTEEVESQRY
jgi:hypothetical protein